MHKNPTLQVCASLFTVLTERNQPKSTGKISLRELKHKALKTALTVCLLTFLCFYFLLNVMSRENISMIFLFNWPVFKTNIGARVSAKIMYLVLVR